MPLAVLLVPYADNDLHDIVKLHTPRMDTQSTISSQQSQPEQVSWWGWGVSLFTGVSTSANTAKEKLYKPDAPDQKKDESFYNREIRLLDEKIKELEQTAIDLNSKIGNCDDSTVKFKLQTELCGLEEVLLGLKYALIKDIEQLANIKFQGPDYLDERTKILKQVEGQRELYRFEESKILAFHDHCLQARPIVQGRIQRQEQPEFQTQFVILPDGSGDWVHVKTPSPKNAFPTLGESRAKYEELIGMQPSYEFLEENETKIHELQEQLLGLNEVLANGAWPTDETQRLSPEDRQLLQTQAYEVERELHKAAIDASRQTIKDLQKELKEVEDILFFQEQKAEQSDPSEYMHPELFIHQNILQGSFSYLLPPQSLADGKVTVTSELLEHLVISMTQEKEKLEERIALQNNLTSNAKNSYQTAAYKAAYVPPTAVDLSGLSNVAGTAATAIYSGVKKVGGTIIGGTVQAASMVKARLHTDLVAGEYKHYEWEETPWGTEILQNKEKSSDFTNTLNPIIDQERKLEAELSVQRKNIKGAPPQAKETRDMVANLRAGERDLEDLRILKNAAILQRLVETMAPHYTARKEQTIIVKDSECDIDTKTKMIEAYTQEIKSLPQRIETKNQEIASLREGLAGLVGGARSIKETTINEALAAVERMEQTRKGLTTEVENLQREISELERKVSHAKSLISIEDKKLAILNDGFEEILLEYQALNPPARPLTELLQTAVWEKLTAIVSLGYANRCYIPPEQFRLKQQKAEICYTSEQGKKALFGTGEINAAPQDQTANFIKQKVKDFLIWAEDHPDMAQALAADLAISLAMTSQSDALTSLVSGIRARATVQAALGDLGRQRQIAPRRLEESDLQWIYLSECVKELSGIRNMGAAAVTGLGTALAAGPMIGGLIGIGAYVWNAGKSELVHSLTASVGNKDLRTAHNLLMKARGDTLAEIAGQEQKLNTLDSFSSLKNTYLRPKGVINGILTRISQQWTAIKVSRGAERYLRIGVFAVPIVATVAAGGIIGLGIAGLAIGPFGTLGLGAALSFAPALIGASLGISNYLFNVANAWGSYNRTWETVKEMRLKDLFSETNPFGKNLKADLKERRETFLNRLRSLSALPASRTNMYDMQPPHIKEWVDSNQELLTKTANKSILDGIKGAPRRAAAAAAEFAGNVAPPLSPREKKELEIAIKSELQYRLITLTDDKLKNEMVSALTEAVEEKKNALDPSSKTHPPRELHPSELITLYRDVLANLPRKVQELAEAKFDELETASGNALSRTERAKVLEIISATLTEKIEKEWLIPNMQDAFEYEFIVIGMRYDNEKQFRKFYENSVKSKGGANVSGLIPKGVDETDAKKLLGKKLEPLIDLSENYLAGSWDDLLYNFGND